MDLTGSGCVKKAKNVRVSLELSHAYLLLNNDSEISNYTTTVTRQLPVKSNRGTVFSVRSVPICCKQDKLVIDLVRKPLDFSRCELLLLEAGMRPETQRKGNIRHWKPLQSNS
jgi:hypothetical protein